MMILNQSKFKIFKNLIYILLNLYQTDKLTSS